MSQCPQSGSLPSPPNTQQSPPQAPAQGIEGITFTPGSPLNLRGGLQIFF